MEGNELDRGEATYIIVKPPRTFTNAERGLQIQQLLLPDRRIRPVLNLRPQAHSHRARVEDAASDKRMVDFYRDSGWIRESIRYPGMESQEIKVESPSEKTIVFSRNNGERYVWERSETPNAWNLYSSRHPPSSIAGGRQPSDMFSVRSAHSSYTTILDEDMLDQIDTFNRPGTIEGSVSMNTAASTRHSGPIATLYLAQVPHLVVKTVNEYNGDRMDDRDAQVICSLCMALWIIWTSAPPDPQDDIHHSRWCICC